LKLYAGRWSDRLGRRKPLVVWGYALSSLSKILFLPAVTWLLILAARVIERVGKGIRSAPRDALIADEVPAEQRGAAFGWQRAMDGAGGCLGALLAVALVGMLSYQQIFAVALVPALVAMALTFALTEHAGAAKMPAATTPAPLPAAVRRAVVACGVFGFGQLSFAFLLLAGGAQGWSDQRILLGYALYQLVYTLISPWSGGLSDRHGRRPVLFAGYALYVLAMALLAFAPGGWLVAVFLLYSVGEAFVDATQRAWITDLAPREQRAAALGAYHSAIAIVALPGGGIVGAIWAEAGIMAAASFAAATAAIAALWLAKR
jgi:MFS family permease